MAPEDKSGLLLGAVEEGELVVGWLEDVDVVEEVGCEVPSVAVADPPLPVLFPGPRFTYASQSGLGAASGHSGAWQMEYNCPLIAGAQRTLYRELKNVLRVLASSLENP